MLRVLQALMLLAALGAPLASARPALAHETREVGDYRFVVGWMVEPAFAGQKNGIDLRVSRKDNGDPVEGLEKTLKAEIIFGAQKRTVDIRTVFRTPGAYTSDLVPTREGDYRFRFFGTAGSASINETFDSAEGKFNKALSIEAIQFPEPAAAIQAAAMAQAMAAPTAPAADTSGAFTFAIIGAVTGVLGLILGVLALMAVGRRSRPAGPTAATPAREVRA